MAPFCIDIPALSAQLPALYQSVAVEIGVTFAASSSDLVHGMKLFAQDPDDSYRGAELALECQGFFAGIHPLEADPALFWRSWLGPHPAEDLAPCTLNPLQMGAEHFLSGVQCGTIGTLGFISEVASGYANIFLDGARRLFPEGVNGRPAFIRSVARAWGRLADQSASGQEQRLLTHSHEMGIVCSEILNDHYRLGLAGGLPVSRLNASLHVRDVPAFLTARGWISGIVESLRRSFRKTGAEPARIIEFNKASITLHALNGGNLLYIRDAVRSVIDPERFLRGLDVSIGEVAQESETTAALLRSRRNLIISKLLHAGNLKITKEILLGLKGWTDN